MRDGFLAAAAMYKKKLRSSSSDGVGASTVIRPELCGCSAAM